MYELILFGVLTVITLILVIIQRDDTFLYFMSVIGIVTLAFFIGQSTHMALFIASGLVSGLLLARIAHDELQVGVTWFVMLSAACFLLGIVGLMLAMPVYTITAAFMLLVCLPSLVRGYRKRKKRH